MKTKLILQYIRRLTGPLPVLTQRVAGIPTAAGTPLKYLIGKGEPAKWSARRTGVLVTCVGLFLFGPMASIKGGLTEDLFEGFGKEAVQYFTIQIIEYGSAQALNGVSQATDGWGTGTLLGILGESSSGDQTAQLDNISSQITTAQNMIAGLQSDLDNFESEANQSLSIITLNQANTDYNTAMATIKKDCTLLDNLTSAYSNVVASCYSNGVLKTNLSFSDLNGFTNLVTPAAPGMWGLNNIPDQVLNDLASASSEVGSTKSVYDNALILLKQSVPFEHQTYAGMYNLFNQIASMRTTALYFKKEYQAYLWSLQAQQTNAISLATWMTNSLLKTTVSGPGVTDTSALIDADVTNNVILSKMATLLTGSGATNGPQRLAYLQGLINTNYLFSGPTNQFFYQVINNNAGQQTYLICKQAGALPVTKIQVATSWGGAIGGNTTNNYAIANYAQHTEDGRFQLAGTNDLSNLFSAGTEPLRYLRGNGGLTNINRNTAFIYLNSPQAQTNFTSNLICASNSINGKGQTVIITQPAVLIDVNNYNAAAPNYVLGANDSFISVSNVVWTAPYSNSLFMGIYYDTHISPALATGPAQNYTPTVWNDLPHLLSLDTGDVLDLTGYDGPQRNTTVRICGNATIVGGGPGLSLSGLTIETYGGNLTLSNLCLTSANGELVINNVRGPLGVVVLGSNSLATTTGPAVVSTSGANITFTGPGSLAVTTADTNAPAVQAAGDIIARGATNLTFSSQGSSSLEATRIFIANSTVTSQVGVESDNEFSASAVTLDSAVLDMTYGTINPTVIHPCKWLRAIRGVSEFTISKDWVGGIGIFSDSIYLSIAGTTGISEFINLNQQIEQIDGKGEAWENGNLCYGSTANFIMSYSIASTKIGDFQGLGTVQSIRIYKQNDWMFTWECKTSTITPLVVGDKTSTYTFPENFWYNTIKTNQTSGTGSQPYQFTINADNTVAITGYSGAGGAITIPAMINGIMVTSIAASAFWANTTLTSVTIPASVTSIHDQAFLDCNGLTAVYFQGNAPGLGANVFAYVNATVRFLPGTTGWAATFADLTTALWVPFTCTNNTDNATVTLTGYTGLGGDVIIPGAMNGLPVTCIGANAFKKCVPLLNGTTDLPIQSPPVASITANAFSNCTPLTSITIPASVTSIHDQAFLDCWGLTAVYFQGSAPGLGTNVFTGDDLAAVYYLRVPGTTGWSGNDGGSTMYGGLPIAIWKPFTCTTNADNATVTLTGYTGSGGTVTIPGTLNGLPVTRIGTNAFTSNVFFSALQITNVLIPNTVTNLGDRAFQMCSNLMGVYFQGNAPSLGANVFSGDKLATAYYLPATTNWPAVPGTFGGLPTALWLTVSGGTDGGGYSNLQQVTITANNPTPTNGLMAPLVQWTGTTQYVANVHAANTTVNLPAQPVALTAMFAVAPVITAQPASLAAISGGNATFSVTAFGPAPLAYQWFFNNSSISGAMAASQTLTGVTTNIVGSYTVVISNIYGSVTSSVAFLTVDVPPSITTQPVSQVVALGGTVSLSVAPDGTAPFVYQWLKDGRMLLGATNSALTLTSADVTNSGVYYVVVTNAYGLSISRPASVTVGTPQLLAWGNNQHSQLGDGTTVSRSNAVSVASNVVVAAAGAFHSLYLKSNGTLWAMGFNGDGELGDGTGVTRNYPESVASNVVFVAAGSWHSLYLKSDGTLWAMGQNNYGQLGDGTMTSRSNAVSVASDVVAVAAGDRHSLYLKSDGTLWAMGYNNFGQLGDGSNTSQSLAESVASNVVAIAAGADHSLYLKSDGTLWAMGWNGEGELGDGTTISRNHAVAVGVGNNVAAVAAGAYHSLFAKADGTLWAMGRNDASQLGDGTTTSRSNAVSVASNVVAVAAGGLHSLYLKSDGALWAMGRNDSGELGDGTVTPWNGQVQVNGMALASVVSGNAAQFTLAVGVPLPPVITSQPASQTFMAGSNVIFTVTATGFAPMSYQWQFNGTNLRWATATNYSLTGVMSTNAGSYTVVVTNFYGSVTSSVAVLVVLTPPTITTAPTNQTVAVGGTVNLGVSTAGDAPLAYQWLKDGRILWGATNSALTLTSAGVTNSGVYSVVVTNAVGMNISQPASVTVGTPQLLAWGYNSYGQLGDGTTTDQHWPESVTTNVVAAAAGNQHTLHLKSDGTLWAVGYNSNGQLGNGNTTNQHTPVFVTNNVVAVAAGSVHSLFVTANGSLYAMGWNGYGQLGNGTTTDQHTPVFVTNNVVAVAAGHYHSLYIRADGSLYAMGYNSNGQLGNGTTTDQHTPVFVTNNVVAVAAGSVHSLYISADGSLYAMGYNSNGQLGNGTTTDQHTPVFVTNNVVMVAAGYSHSLYISAEGTLRAMGDNNDGQLGDGTTISRSNAVSIASNVMAVTAGYYHSLYISANGVLWAMGNNGNGQLGDDTTINRSHAVAITGISLGTVVSGLYANHTLAIGMPLPPPTAIVTVIAAPASAGSVAGGGVYLVGSNAVLTATATNGWQFLNWTGGMTNNPYAITVPGTNVTYTADFTASNPTNLASSISSNALTIAWPEDHLGWVLQALTNVLTSTNWFDVPGTGGANSAVIPINPANPAVFYRLRLP